MSAWFDDASDALPETAWATYHENAKRGRRHDIVRDDRRPASPGAVEQPLVGQAFALQAGGSLVMLPGEGTVDTAYAGDGTMALASLAALLAAAARPTDDPIETWLYANAVEALPAGLYRHDRAGRTLHLRGRQTFGGPLAAATTEPALVKRAQAVVLLVGNLAAATLAHGERGYRNAVFATGRQAAGFDQAVGASGLWCRTVAGYYDREIDALLALDGLSQSVLCMVAIGTAAGD